MAKKLQKKERLTNRLISVLIFLVVFNSLSIPLYIAVYTNFSFEPLKELNARMVSTTFEILGYDVFSEGSTVNVILHNIPQKIDISWDSTGWKSMYALASLIIATPISKISRRIKFAALGIAIIFLINYLRVFTTILISVKFGFNWFDIVHTVLWREGLILAVVGVWALWLRMEKYNFEKIKIN